jgi:hypothetical protein
LDDIVRQLDSDATYLKKGVLGGGINSMTQAAPTTSITEYQSLKTDFN